MMYSEDDRVIAHINTQSLKLLTEDLYMIKPVNMPIGEGDGRGRELRSPTLAEDLLKVDSC